MKKTDYSTKRDSFSVSGNCLRELIRSVIDKGALFRFRAHGNSMSPFIKDGDILTLAPIGNIRLSIGEIVAFVNAENLKLSVHRIIGKEAESYCLKGDNLQTADGMVSGRNILARVVSVERSGKINRFGLGTERFVIAFLQRHDLFRPVMVALCRLKPNRTAHATAVRNTG